MRRNSWRQWPPLRNRQSEGLKRRVVARGGRRHGVDRGGIGRGEALRRESAQSRVRQMSAAALLSRAMHLKGSAGAVWLPFRSVRRRCLPAKVRKCRGRRSRPRKSRRTFRSSRSFSDAVGWACLQGAAENAGSLRRAKAPCAGTDRRSALFRALRAGGASAGEASALISCGRRQWATNEHHWSASLLVGCDDDYGTEYVLHAETRSSKPTQGAS
jgi:hypothetical protein